MTCRFFRSPISIFSPSPTTWKLRGMAAMYVNLYPYTLGCTCLTSELVAFETRAEPGESERSAASESRSRGR